MERIVYFCQAIFCPQPEDKEPIVYFCSAIFCLQPEDKEHIVHKPSISMFGSDSRPESDSRLGVPGVAVA